MKYKVTVPYLTIVEHIIEIDPNNMPPLALSPEQYAQITAENTPIEEGKTLYTDYIDSPEIYPTTVKKIKS